MGEKSLALDSVVIFSLITCRDCRVPPKKEVDWHIFHSFHTHEKDCTSTYFYTSKVKNSIIIWKEKKITTDYIT